MQTMKAATLPTMRKEVPVFDKNGQGPGILSHELVNKQNALEDLTFAFLFAR